MHGPLRVDRSDGRSLLMPSWIGPWEIAIVLVLALLIFGPRKLPDLGASLGKSIRGFRKGMQESQDEVKSALAEVRESAEVKDAEPAKSATAEPVQATIAEPAKAATAEPESKADPADKAE
jgi:sec-independent protein translocase protein TatA